MTHPNLQNFNILIADDELLVRNLVTNVLLSLGFRNITSVNSGRKAIDAISKKQFDFIITDWRMGDMDGIDILRHVRATSEPTLRRIPVIMLTGNTEMHYVKTAIDEGVNGYLIKPFSAEQLVKRIKSIIDTPRDFVLSSEYTGPDRRHSEQPPPAGIDRRRRKPRK